MNQQITRAARVRAALGAVAVCGFALYVGAQVVPGSPWNAIERDDLIGRAPLAQRWNLFAPDPPAADLSTFVEVGYRDGSGARYATRMFDLSRAVRTRQVEGRLAPPRLVRVVARFNAGIETEPPTMAPDAYRRLLSSVAQDLAPEGVVIERVRGTVIRTWTQPFTERNEQPRERSDLVYDTGWLLYEPDVERFDVVRP